MIWIRVPFFDHKEDSIPGIPFGHQPPQVLSLPWVIKTDPREGLPLQGHQKDEAQMAGKGASRMHGMHRVEESGFWREVSVSIAQEYKLLSHNCQSFAVELVSVLLPNVSVPSEYCRQPQT